MLIHPPTPTISPHFWNTDKWLPVSGAKVANNGWRHEVKIQIPKALQDKYLSVAVGSPMDHTQKKHNPPVVIVIELYKYYIYIWS